jgi:putative sigma-54 modulation protein
MNIEITGRHAELSQTLKSHIQQKLQFSLNWFEQHICKIYISLADVNGPRGGVDKQCTLQLFLANMNDIVIKDTQATLSLAVDRAIQRAGRSVACKVDRQQDRSSS